MNNAPARIASPQPPALMSDLHELALATGAILCPKPQAISPGIKLHVQSKALRRFCNFVTTHQDAITRGDATIRWLIANTNLILLEAEEVRVYSADLGKGIAVVDVVQEALCEHFNPQALSVLGLYIDTDPSNRVVVRVRKS